MVGSMLVVGCLLIGQADGQAPDELKATVRRLARQLDAPQLDKRDVAERELTELGPDVLDLLPPSGSRTPAEVKQRMARIRRTLQQAAAERAAEPSRVTLREDAIPLSKCLAEISRQTGNRIVDFRDQFGQAKTDPALKVDFDKTPFWVALGEVLDQAELVVYPFGPDRAVHLVTRSAATTPADEGVSLAGPLQFMPLDLFARRGLRDPTETSLRLKMQVAWEPRLAPISLKQTLANVTAIDERGQPLTIDGAPAELEVPVDPETMAVELTLPMALPPREVKQIANLAGELDALLPGREVTFRFDKLAEAKNVKQQVAGVTVTLERVRKNHEIWEVWVRVQFDKAGGALESHRGWVFNNPAYLEGPDGKPLENDGFETTRRTENEVGLAYLFDLEKPLENYTFVYKTPSAILAAKFRYEFKNLKLP